MLGIPIAQVPIECDALHWDWSVFQEWLSDHNLQAVEMTFQNGGTLYPVSKPVPCIVAGYSPRNPENLHAVVATFIGMEGFQMEHDPHEDDTWIDGEPTHATFFVSTADIKIKENHV